MTKRIGKYHEIQIMNKRMRTDRGMETQLRITAYHEAGHAVVALLLGIEITEVFINRQQPDSGRVLFRVASLYPQHRRASWVDAPFRWARLLSFDQRNAVFTLAGPLAEAKLLGKPLRTLGSIGDLEVVHQLVRSTNTPSGQIHGVVDLGANMFFERTIRRTRRILSRPPVWAAVTEVASNLLSWHRLTSDDVAEMVQWAFGGCRQMGLFAGGRMAP